jgi:hypothetical protein
MNYKVGDYVKLVYSSSSCQVSIYIGKIYKIDGYHIDGKKKNRNLILCPYTHYTRDSKGNIYNLDRNNIEGRFYLYDSIEKVIGIEESIFTEIL